MVDTASGGCAQKRQQVREKLGQLEGRAAEFVDEACLDRYLRARDGDIEKASHLLAETIKWRHDFDLGTLKFDDHPVNISAGKFYIAGKAENGQPVLILRKREKRLERDEEDGYIKFICSTLESVTQYMSEGVEKWVWLLDLKGYSSRNSPRIAVTLSVLKILANHFPERMGKCYVVDAPSIFSMLWTAVYPFIDPVTKEKVQFAYSDHYGENGETVNGKQDKTGFGEYISYLRTPFDLENYKAILDTING